MDRPLPAIVASRALPAEEPMLRTFFSQYLEELAALGAGYARDVQGQWQPDHLPYWLALGEDHHAFVLRDGGRPVGLAFVVAAPSPYVSPGQDHRLSEFFVLPEERRRGVGEAGARVVFDMFPGRWELSELPENRRALAFWRRVVGAYTGGRYLETTVDGDPTQRFDNRRARAFGRTGLVVPAVGLGAGRIGGPESTDADVDRLVGAALDAGVWLFDSARSYGLSEERLGHALGGGRRERAVVSTKIGYGIPGLPDWTGATIDAGVDAALGRLRTDRLDIVHLHSCPRDVLERGEVVAALARAVQAGKVRVAAYSGEDDALLWAVRSGAFGSIQCSISVVDQTVLGGAVAEARARGLGVLAKRPLGNAPWRFAAAPAEPDVAEAWRRFGALGLDAGGLDWSELFTRFVAYAPGVDSILLGTASVAHLAAAVRAVDRGPLEPERFAAVRAAHARVGSGWGGRI
jgi:aryl-alcohol dehydrogenase-like predicted oxidoreductase/predicted acetyltransferase